MLAAQRVSRPGSEMVDDELEIDPMLQQQSGQQRESPRKNTAKTTTTTTRKRSKAPARESSSDQMEGPSRLPAADGDDERQQKNSKRKKVSKACIFCKRSHMTCTENRPCDRCIKRDIAHLCTDNAPSHRASAEASPMPSPPLPITTTSEPSYPSQASTNSPATATQPLQPPTQIHPHQRTDPTKVQHSPTSFSQVQLQPTYQQPIFSEQQQAGPSSFAQFTTQPLQSSPAYSSPGLPVLSLQDQNNPQQLQQTSLQESLAPMLLSPPQQDQQQQQQPSFNPFALLNQAYDYSYPSNAASSNSLASLRLFATTADAQFGGFGGNNFGLNGTSLGLLGSNNNAYQSSSPAGTGSDIDGTNALDEFLKSLDEMYLNPMPDVPQEAPNLQSQPTAGSSTYNPSSLSKLSPGQATMPDFLGDTAPSSRSLSPILGTSASGAQTSTEKFLLLAADQKEGTRDERLNKVIRAKWEAGLLKPFNHVKGYERLNTWMEKKWQQSSKLRTLKIISEFRPAFRAIAQGLTDLDLIFIEEAFERLLLDCDRLFSTMGIPACLWRRTGEIYKGNREFAELVGLPYDQLREGKLAIYELMTEDSAVNFWEKYGSIAFDPGQKAVLTSCVLVNQTKLTHLTDGTKTEHASRPIPARTSTGGLTMQDAPIASASIALSDVPKQALVYCTFSFTIRRDAYHIPNAIVGNFMPYTPKL